MTQLITKYWLICIFLFAAYSTNAQFEKADSLRDAGELALAKLEYERIIFQNTDPEIANKAIFKKALIQKSVGDYKSASQTLQRSNLFVNQNELNFSIRRETILTSYLSGNYNTALAQLKQAEYFFKNTGYKELLYLHVLTLNEMRQWGEAKIKYEEYISMNGNTGLTAEEAYYFIDKTKLKDPKKAETLSYLLPGVGQMYAGYFGKGLLSSAIQGSLMAFGAYSLYEGYFFTGALTGIGLFYSFYSGGVRHARYLALKKNEELTRKYNDPIKDALIEAELNKEKASD